MSAGSPAEPTRNESANSATNNSAQHVELTDMVAQQAALPIEDDIMQLARLGEIGAIQKLFDAGKADATYKDEQGITPLHVRVKNTNYESQRLT